MISVKLPRRLPRHGVALPTLDEHRGRSVRRPVPDFGLRPLAQPVDICQYSTDNELRIEHMGAGVIPFAVRNGKVSFLFHKTFSGRRTGFLVDFGGGARDGESYRQTAVREFVEETDTMFLEPDLRGVRRTPDRVREQLSIMEALFDRTLNAHPDWWCQRRPGKKIPPKDWRTFFIELDYRDVAEINREWARDDGTRFKKPRHLLWVPADELVAIYDTAPERLWKRVRQLVEVRQTIGAIVAEKETAYQVRESSAAISSSGS